MPGRSARRAVKRTLQLALAALVPFAIGLGVLILRSPLELPELEVPSRLYARPHRVQAGQSLAISGLADRMVRLGYREIAQGEPRPGEFRRGRRALILNRRPFRSPLGSGEEGRIELRLRSGDRISSIRGPGGRLSSVLLEPEIVGVLHGEERVDRYLVPLPEMPRHLIEAVLTVEDRRFFEHRGVDLRRTIGAFFANLRAGRIVQGGSTLTQQLVKNVFLTDERTVARKLREAWLALRVERGQTKQEILEAYLNTIYMGQRGSVSVRGMEAATRHYFGKHVQEISLAEAALLAGLIRGPGLYSPFRQPEAALARRNLVLEMLRESSDVDAEEIEQAQAEPLGQLPDAPRAVSAAYFTAYVKRQLDADFPEVDAAASRLSVYTGLDAQLQLIAERAVKGGLEQLEKDFPNLRDEDAPLQAALVVLDAKSGDILAHVGGRDFGQSQFDRVTQARRQPGSVFKPIVALAALSPRSQDERYFTLATLLEDEPLLVETPEGPWEPANNDQEFRGAISLREAIEQSINVPIARLGIELGPRRIISTARRMGIQSRLQAVPSLALGSFETTPLEIASAYAVLASGGRHTLTRSYLRVRDIDGRDLPFAEPESKRVFKPAEIALVNSALQGAVDRGTGASLRSRGFHGVVAGKTGTTNDGRDAWFVGYTPALVAAVWVGYDDNRKVGLTGSRVALPIFARFIKGAQGSRGGAPFPQPPGLVEVLIHAESGLRASFGCGGHPELFLVGTAPVENCAPDFFGIFGRRDRDDTNTERDPEADPRAPAPDQTDPPPRRKRGWVRVLESVFDAIGGDNR